MMPVINGDVAAEVGVVATPVVVGDVGGEVTENCLVVSGAANSGIAAVTKAAAVAVGVFLLRKGNENCAERKKWSL